MHQYWFIECNKCITPIQYVNKGRVGKKYAGTLSAQFFWKPKTALKMSINFLKNYVTKPNLNRKIYTFTHTHRHTHTQHRK